MREIAKRKKVLQRAPVSPTTRLKLSVHFVEYFPCGCFDTEGFAKQEFLLYFPIIYTTYIDANLG